MLNYKNLIAAIILTAYSLQLIAVVVPIAKGTDANSFQSDFETAHRKHATQKLVAKFRFQQKPKTKIVKSDKSMENSETQNLHLSEQRRDDRISETLTDSGTSSAVGGVSVSSEGNPNRLPSSAP